VGKKQEMPNTGYAVIRCDGGVIVARLRSFPVCERALMSRRGDTVSFMPLQHDEIVGILSLFAQMVEKASLVMVTSFRGVLLISHSNSDESTLIAPWRNTLAQRPRVRENI